ncbi:MAG: hypothetical protein ACXV3E_04235, partial [Halobacteriota archaeon]
MTNAPFVQWERVFAYAKSTRLCRAVQQTADGGYIVAGGETPSSDSSGVYLLKTDENGIEQWLKTFGDPNRDGVGYSVQQTADGGYIVAGYETPASGPPSAIYLLKTDKDGNAGSSYPGTWERTFEDPNRERIGSAVQQTADGGYIVAGYETPA